MESIKKPSRYIRIKIAKLLATFSFFKNRIKKYKSKKEEHKDLATGFDEGQSNFYQKSIESCKIKLKKIKQMLQKITKKNKPTEAMPEKTTTKTKK